MVIRWKAAGIVVLVPIGAAPWIMQPNAPELPRCMLNKLSLSTTPATARWACWNYVPEVTR
jgi:hypothetical protein